MTHRGIRPTWIQRCGITCVALLAMLLLPAAASADRSTHFNSPGNHTYFVGAGVTSVTIQAIGGNGGASLAGGGRGAVISGELTVSPGQILNVTVAGNGGNNNGGTSGSAGFNGGGIGGFAAGTAAGGGGGGSDVRTTSGTLLIVAGGGGGAGGSHGGYDAGQGSALPSVPDAMAGTDTAGGSGGIPLGDAFGGDTGSFRQGGRGGPGFSFGGGGGGGGYYGGGGGGGCGRMCPVDFSGRGAGGSSYIDPTATNVSGPTTPGSTNPSVTITPINPPPDEQAPSIDIGDPDDGATYSRNQVVNAEYACADAQGGEGLATCEGDVADGSPIDTSTFGPHSFEVTATDNVGNEDTETVDYTVADTTNPTATIDSPADDASFAQHEAVNADFTCGDEVNGSGIATCVGTVGDGQPLDTSSYGQKTFEVTATDNAGNDFTRTFHYDVTDTADPDVTITKPADGAVFDRGEDVRADFECADQAGGSGIDTCVGTVADGAAIDTSTLGQRTFSVTATDDVGNDRTEEVTYRVADRTRPQATISSPADGATFEPGETVVAEYSCSDAGGSGLANCAGDVANGQPIDTSTPGEYQFAVTATDGAGNTATERSTYTVRAAAEAPVARSETEIVGIRVKNSKRKAVATLSATPAAAGFECRLDSRPFEACDSPVTLRRLDPGRHVFRARALNSRGEPDETPARREFRVERARRR